MNDVALLEEEKRLGCGEEDELDLTLVEGSSVVQQVLLDVGWVVLFNEIEVSVVRKHIDELKDQTGEQVTRSRY